MAGYKSPNYQQQFTPYISTANADLYGQAIIQAQGQYDQGVERVQQYIDNTTGLKVARPEDQQYLSQKISELKNNIEGIGKADYRLSDVVKQAGSIVSKTFNDKRVQKDVISAANYADAQNQIAEAQKKGTYKDSNAFAVKEHVDAWMNGGADAALGKVNYEAADEYTPRFSKYMKDAHPQVVIDQSQPLDANGNPSAYVVNNNQRTYLSQSEVEQYFHDFLQGDGKAKRQVELDTNYASKTTPYEQGYSTFLGTLDAKLKQRQTDLKNLMEQKALVSKGHEDSKAYDTRIKSLETSVKEAETELNNGSITYASNPQEANARMYQDQLYAAQARRFVRNDTKTEQGINPVAEFQLKLDKDSRDAAKDALDMQKTQAEINKLNGKNTVGLPSDYGDLLPPDQATKDVNYGAPQMEQELKADNQMIWDQRADLAYKWLGDEVTKDYLTMGEDGKIRVKDYTKLAEANQKMYNAYLGGNFENKTPREIERLQKFYESGDAEYGMGLQLQYTARRKEWDTQKNKIINDTPQKIKDEFSKVYTQVGNTQITGKDLYDYKVGTLEANKKNLIDQALATTKQSFDYSKNDQTRQIYGLVGAVNSFNAKFEEQINPSLNSAAQTLKTAVSNPSYKIEFTGDKENDVNSASKVNTLVNVLAKQNDSGGDKTDRAAVIKYLQGVSDKDETGSPKQKPNIEITKDSGVYHMRVVNMPNSAKIEISPQIASMIAPALTQPSIISAYQKEMSLNRVKGIPESFERVKPMFASPNGGGYMVKYKFTQENGKYYPEVSYLRSGQSNEYRPLKGLSQGFANLTEANAALQAIFGQTKEQMEDTIKQYDKN